MKRLSALGILLFALSLGFAGCLSRIEDPDERFVDGFIEDAQAGRLVSFSDRLSTGFKVSGYHGGLSAHPTHEELMRRMSEFRYWYGIGSPTALIRQNTQTPLGADVVKWLGLGPGEAAIESRVGTYVLRVSYGYPQSIALGDFADVIRLRILRTRVGSANCSMMLVGTGLCTEGDRTEARIVEVEILDPRLMQQ